MNKKAKKELVNVLRHEKMDSIVFDSKNNETYVAVYSAIMLGISSAYPFLSKEVKRQMDKKFKWQSRRALEKQQVSIDT